MFEWNGEDGLTDTIWSDLINREDYVGRYQRTGTDDDFRHKDHANELKDDKKQTLSRSYGKNSSHTDHPSINHDCTMQYLTEVSGQRFHMDAWSSFTSKESSTGKDDGNDQCSTSSIFNDFTDTPRFNHARDKIFAASCSREVENDSELGHSEVDSFLNCDWASITNFVDVDGIFSDSGVGSDDILSHGNADNTSEEPVRVPENAERPEENNILEDCKKSDPLWVRRKADSIQLKGHLRSHPYASKIIGQRKLLKSRGKDEQNSISDFEKTSNILSHEEHAYLGYYPSPQTVMGYGYPATPFYNVPLVPFVPNAKLNVQYDLAVNCNRGCVTNHATNQQEASSRTLTMTPQEKIEKLRRRQQMQAMLAIKQQEKQYAPHISSDAVTLSQLPSLKDSIFSSVTNAARTEDLVSSSAHSLPVERDGSLNISISSDDGSFQEKIFHELQETVVKLDPNVRLCMRNSLFRLAKSAMERCRDNTRTFKSITMSNDNLRTYGEPSGERGAALLDAETDTNPIDRTVAHLLFHKPSQLISATQKLNERNGSHVGMEQNDRATRGKSGSVKYRARSNGSYYHGKRV